MPEYRRHAFEKDWHDKVEEFIEENDLAFDSPKYFIKFCVNKYMDDFSRDKRAEEYKSLVEAAEDMDESERMEKLKKRFSKMEDSE